MNIIFAADACIFTVILFVIAWK